MLLLDGRSAAYQWDSNLYLIIPGGKVGDDIHFGRNKTAAVVRAESRDGRIVAVVPNIELQTDGEIDVYRYIYDAKGNRTIWADKLTVQPRERPDDYVYEETPVKTWNELDSRIKSLEQTVAVKLQAEIDGKIQMPDGGDAGDVLKKTESGVEWGQLSGGSDIPVILRAVMNPDGIGGLDELSITKMDFISDSYKNGIPVPAILSTVVEVPGRSLHTWHQMDHVQIIDGVWNFYFATGSEGKIYIAPSTTSPKWSIVVEGGT